MKPRLLLFFFTLRVSGVRLTILMGSIWPIQNMASPCAEERHQQQITIFTALYIAPSSDIGGWSYMLRYTTFFTLTQTRYIYTNKSEPSLFAIDEIRC